MNKLFSKAGFITLAVWTKILDGALMMLGLVKQVLGLCLGILVWVLLIWVAALLFLVAGCLSGLERLPTRGSKQAPQI